MKFLDLEIYNDFKCIGSDCPFTCCSGGWRIIIDSETDAYYKSVKGEMGERLKNSICRSDKGLNFKLTEEGACPFLNEEKLCDIYINLGEEHMCYTCKTYPRYMFVSGDIAFSGVSISCPEVAGFFLSHKDLLQIDFAETEDKLDIAESVDWNVFNQAIRAFTTAIELVQNRTIAVRERLAILSLFLFQFQAYINNKRDSSGLIELFSDETQYMQILPEAEIHTKDLRSKLDFSVEVMSYFRHIPRFVTLLPELYNLVSFFTRDEGIDVLTSRWESAYSIFDEEDEQIWQEQVIVYTLFRYFMQGFDERDFYDKFIAGFLLVYQFCMSIRALYFLQWDKKPDYDYKVMSLAHISRVIEHDTKFRDAAIKHFCEKGMTDPAFLLRLIS